jgi:hypothetical protein
MNAEKEDALKINAGGGGMVLVSVIAAIPGWFFVVSVIDWLISSRGNITLEFLGHVILAFVPVGFFLAIAFAYWRFNFIELRDGNLSASFWNRTRRAAWPGFIRTSIALEDIETVSRGTSKFCSPAFIIIAKDKKTHFIDTKPFSKADCLRLIKELEKRGIVVET